MHCCTPFQGITSCTFGAVIRRYFNSVFKQMNKGQEEHCPYSYQSMFYSQVEYNSKLQFPCWQNSFKKFYSDSYSILSAVPALWSTGPQKELTERKTKQKNRNPEPTNQPTNNPHPHPTVPKKQPNPSKQTKPNPTHQINKTNKIQGGCLFFNFGNQSSICLLPLPSSLFQKLNWNHCTQEIMKYFMGRNDQLRKGKLFKLNEEFVAVATHKVTDFSPISTHYLEPIRSYPNPADCNY